MSTGIFIDTGAFLALVDEDDQHHVKAKRFVRTLPAKGRSLLTSTYVLDESITLIRMRIGHAAAANFGERLFRTRWCRVIDIDDVLRRAAWDLFLRYDDQVFSFTDCTSFALMHSMGVTDAFSFDGDFSAAGMTRLPV